MKNIRTEHKNSVLFYIIPILIIFTGSRCMKTDLNEQEKKQLSDIEKFNNTIGSTGWHLENRKIARENLEGIKLNNSFIINVDLLNVNMANSEIHRSTFEKVGTFGSDFSNSRMIDINFNSCDLTSTKFDNAEFTRCFFKNCKAEDIHMEKATFRECVFDNFSDQSGIFNSSKFDNCRFKDSGLVNSSFYYSCIDSTVFESNILTRVRFANSNIHNLKFARVSFDFCSFDETTSEQITFERCKSKCISFRNAKLSELILAHCGEFRNLFLDEVDCKKLSIQECKFISEPTFHQSKIYELAIANSQIEYLDWSGSEFFNKNKIVNTYIYGANFSQSKIKGLTIENSTFDNYLILTQSEFEDLILKNVKFAEKIEIESKEVTYTRSDQFPSK